MLRWFSFLSFAIASLMCSLVHADPRQQAIDSLLLDADTYFAQDQLTTPSRTNAYDRYKAVLILDPGNQRANLGIRAIADRYLQMSANLLKQKRFQAATGRLNDAISIGGQSGKTRQLANQIREAKKVYQAPVINVVPEMTTDGLQKTVVLDMGNLKARSAQMVNELTSLGSRVQSTKEYVEIYARNDAEGRWIYQQIRKASPNHRVRGNILRSKTPRVVFQPPLH